ncbi:MAG: hypothetical protein KA712_24710 [Myxococcales bacterium]|nr:hypothetical protein [Myxococcales bacterium]
MKNSKTKLLLAAVPMIAGFLIAAPASANVGARVKDMWLSPIAKTSVFLDANVTYVITTSNLQPLVPGGTPDTVIHVQNQDANGSFVAGNDDFNGLASQVTVTVPTSKSVDVLIRAYNSSRAGTATLTITRAGVTQSSFPITFAGSTQMTSSLPVQSHVMTVEQFNGPSDSMLLVLSGSASNAIAFDDDDGVGLQSWIHLDQGCSTCIIVYGRFNNGPEGPATLIYDGDVHTADADADGMGNALETAIGTSTTDRDSDDDGLDDGLEVGGLDSSPALKLPMWGANPLTKDMFVEADWAPCLDPNTCSSQDAWQLTGAAAEAVEALYAPDVKVHIDIGRTNSATTLDQWSKWGNWGGANRAAYTTQCGTVVPARANIFHHYHVTSAGEGGQSLPPPSKCAYGGNGHRTMAHELGHNLGLFHEGNTGSGRMNNKPNYLSLMNYAFSYDGTVGLSRNTISATINPSSLNEATTGLPSSLITKIQNNFSFLADPAGGKVDWNRDGQYDNGVRGAPGWIVSNAPEVTAAWVDPNVEDGIGIGMTRLSSPARLYMFSRRTSDQKVQYRYTTSFAACSGGDPIGACQTWVGPTVIGNSVGGSTSAPTAHPVIIGGVEKLMLIYTDSGGTMWYQIGTSNDVWSAPKSIDTTAVGYEPAFAMTAAKYRVYFRKFSVLYRRDYDPVTDTWGAAQWEKTTTNASIATSFGVSITQGMESSVPGSSYYMALADWTNGNQVQLWRHNASADNWTQIVGAWGVTPPATDAAPALAYVPLNLANQPVGQFYIAYNTVDATGENIIRFAKTEGNDSSAGATTRRLKWLTTPIPIYNYWGTAVGSPELYFKLGVDGNLRAAYHYAISAKITFYPVADGSANVTLKDQNDFYYLSETLDCSLGAGGCITL